MKLRGIDAAAPGHQVLEPLGSQFAGKAGRRHHAAGAAIMEPAHEGVEPALGDRQASRHIFRKAGVVAGGKGHALADAPPPRRQAERAFRRDVDVGRIVLFDLAGDAAVPGDRQADLRVGGAGDAGETLGRHHRDFDAHPGQFAIGVFDRADDAIDLRMPGIGDDHKPLRHGPSGCGTSPAFAAI